ncbi:DNA-binding response OmpR family regulator [Novosphingobium sp. SG751A]|nr:response regulator [Novosphingobium sp. SG751A]NOW48698.1 DNA-binding response OmpR family regulator [Novosphingobium sp. SG751A]
MPYKPSIAVGAVMRILLIEDDLPLATALGQCLADASMATDHASTLEEAALLLSTNTYAAVVLDRGLPDGDGLTLLHRLRQKGDGTATVVLTARGDVQARIAGLDAGADDYMAKPFSPDELVARIRAVLRRNGSFQGREMACANLLFDLDNLSLRIDGKLALQTTCDRAVSGCLQRKIAQTMAAHHQPAACAI